MATVRSGRIGSIDFWRGAALITIFVDHIPDNLLGFVTVRNFGFSDAAEAFIFLSGVVLAYAHWPRLVAGRVGEVARRCLRRAGELYLTQVGLTLAAAAMFFLAYLAGGGDGMIVNDNRAHFFAHPLSGLAGVVLLTYQFGYFNILSVYVVLMVMAAGMLIVMRRSLALALALSAAIYLASRFGLAMPSWPLPYTWFINPFAWQFLFTIGMAVGAALRGEGIPYRRSLFVIALAFLTASLFFTTLANHFGAMRTLGSWLWLETDKGTLGLVRLTHFLALAYVVGKIGLGERLLVYRWGRGVAEIGRHSLSMFAAGSLLSAFGQIILAQAPLREANFPAFHGTGLLVVVAGVTAMVAISRQLTARQTRARAIAGGS